MKFLILVAMGVPVFWAQAQTVDKSRFEAASLRPNKDDGGFMGGECHGVDTKVGSGGIAALAQMAKATVAPAPTPLGRCRFTRVSLQMLIGRAYLFGGAFRPDQKISGGPNWLDADKYNVEAVAPDPGKATEAQLASMLQALLEDRFKLKVHSETRQIAGFALVVAKGGSKMQPATGNEEGKGLMSIAGRPLTAKNVSMLELVRFLTGRVNRNVIDETKLTGGYNFSLKWTPADNEGGFANMPNLPPELRAQLDKALSANDPNGPSLGTALQEQLGLRLEAKTVPTEFLVIDSAERPEPN